MRAGRFHKLGSAALVVALVTVLIVGVALLAGCGSSDKWAGTWVQVDDTKTGLVIESKGGDKYNVHDPDGKNAFDATVQADGTLKGTVNFAAAGAAPINAEFTFTQLDSGNLKVTIAAGDQKLEYELKPQ
jgi:hypothetical protein